MSSTVSPKEMDERDYLFFSCLWFVDYSHYEIDMRAMPIIKNEKRKKKKKRMEKVNLSK